MFSNDLNLRGLINLEDWQKIQDSFSEVLELGLSTISLEGKLLTRASRPSRLCSEILPQSPSYHEFCANCILKKELKYVIETQREMHFQCALGLDVFVVPIKAVGERTVAYIAIGPVFLKRRKDASELSAEAKRIAVPLERLMDALVEISLFSYNRINSVTAIIKDVFSYMVRAGYHKKRLGEMAPEIMQMDPLFSRYYEEKILNSMLNACMLALDTDSGSVMTLDRKTNKLHIKAAAKLDENIVQNTGLKVGEGIAGVAVQTAKPIILPEDEAKSGLSAKMKRNYIKSSMIVPFAKEKSHDVYGVINLNMLRKNINFSKKDIAFVQELLNLTSTALAAFQQNNSN